MFKEFSCKLISTQVYRVEPGPLLSEPNNNSAKNKRPLSMASEAAPLPSTTRQCIDESFNTINTVNEAVVETTFTPEYFLSIEKQKEFDDFNLDVLYTLAKQKIFPPKTFIIGSKKRNYTPVTQLFKCQLEYTEKPGSISFECKTKGCKLFCALGEFTNLNKHLLTHNDTRAWYNSYRSSAERINMLTNQELKLIRLFIASHQSLTLISSNVFSETFKSALPVPDYKTFRNTLLPSALEKMKKYIETKLNSAFSVVIIPDLWEKNQDHYIGLGAILSFSTFERLFVILGFKPIYGNSAEDI